MTVHTITEKSNMELTYCTFSLTRLIVMKMLRLADFGVPQLHEAIF